jgi:CheY-like chemotaxis protein
VLVPKILILDDEPVNRLLLVTILASAGHDSIEASTGPEALLLARERCPDLIVLDLRLPGMDGPEFVKALRSDPAIADTRLALYTGTEMSALLHDFMAISGIRHVIPKPGEPEEVLRVIELALEEP